MAGRLFLLLGSNPFYQLRFLKKKQKGGKDEKLQTDWTTAHGGAIDYGFGTIQALAPTLFNLKGPAKTLCYAFAGVQGVLNALTDHPRGLKRVLPLKVHGQLETPFVPSLHLLPWMTGALKQRNARLYFFSFFGIALANYLLSDYNAYEQKSKSENK